MFITIIAFLIILGILVLVHELGHFFTARLFKVKAEEFGLGFPPRAIGFVKVDGKWQRLKKRDKEKSYKNTIWSLNWLPLGGFVKIKGEDENALKESDSFAARPAWQRFIIMVAGVTMNFILAFILLSIGFMTGIPSLVDDNPDPSLGATNEKIQIMSVRPDSPAELAELKVGDVILSINNQEVSTIASLQENVSSRKDQATVFTLQRGGEVMNFDLTPIAAAEGEKAVIGVGLVKTATVSYPWYKAIYKGAETTVNLTLAIFKAFGNIIGDLVTGQKVDTEVAGPIGIAVLTGQVVSLGFIYILQFAALLSINLAMGPRE